VDVTTPELLIMDRFLSGVVGGGLAYNKSSFVGACLASSLYAILPNVLGV